MRLLEIASAEEQIALWRLVSDNVWAALQLQQDQAKRAAVSTAARDDTKAGVAAKTSKPKSRGIGTKNPALKRVLRGYGKVPRLPSVPVPPRPGATTSAQASKPEPVGATTSGRASPGGPTTPAAVSNQRSTAGQTRPQIKPFGIRGTAPLDLADTRTQPPTNNQSKTPHLVDYRGGSGENARRPNDQGPNGQQA